MRATNDDKNVIDELDDGKEVAVVDELLKSKIKDENLRQTNMKNTDKEIERYFEIRRKRRTDEAAEDRKSSKEDKKEGSTPENLDAKNKRDSQRDERSLIRADEEEMDRKILHNAKLGVFGRPLKRDEVEIMIKREEIKELQKREDEFALVKKEREKKMEDEMMADKKEEKDNETNTLLTEEEKKERKFKRELREKARISEKKKFEIITSPARKNQLTNDIRESARNKAIENEDKDTLRNLKESLEDEKKAEEDTKAFEEGKISKKELETRSAERDVRRTARESQIDKKIYEEDRKVLVAKSLEEGKDPIEEIKKTATETDSKVKTESITSPISSTPSRFIC